MFGITFRSCLTAMAVATSVMWFNAVAASAATLDFESVGTPGAQVEIPDGYGDLNWNNFYVLNGVEQYPEYPGNGYGTGASSGVYVGFNGFADPASIVSGSTFDFISASLTAAFNEGLMLDVAGYRDGVQLYFKTVTLSTALYANLLFNWSGIDQLTFKSYGGTPVFGKNGRQFALDDLQVVKTPIPAALPFLAIGLAGLGFAARRRRAVTKAA